MLNTYVLLKNNMYVVHHELCYILYNIIQQQYIDNIILFSIICNNMLLCYCTVIYFFCHLLLFLLMKEAP